MCCFIFLSAIITDEEYAKKLFLCEQLITLTQSESFLKKSRLRCHYKRNFEVSDSTLKDCLMF